MESECPYWPKQHSDTHICQAERVADIISLIEGVGVKRTQTEMGDGREP